MRLLPHSFLATPARRLLARVVFYGAALFLALPFAFSQVMIGAIRQPPGPTAAGYQEVRVHCESLTLRAWVAPGDPGFAAVVLVHGVGDALESYESQAAVLRARGHTVLLLDLRGHGGSDRAPTTLGGHEREDVRAAMAHLRRAGLAPAGFVLMGWSMGAVAVLRAAAVETDVRAVVAEAPFETYRETVARHAWLFYRVPRWLPLLPLSIAIAEWRAGFDADQVDAVAAARSFRAPLLLIADGADDRMPEAVVRRVFDAHPGPKALWVAAGAPHVGAVLSAEYWPRIFDFLADSGC
jgi:pimeloyl-ACP methyl ester carboxylesterase